MSVVLQLIDFTASGVLGSAWTATGGTFTQNGSSAYATTPATYSRAVLNATPTFSISTAGSFTGSHYDARYEVDFTLPTSFSSGELVVGLVFAGGTAHFVWRRATNGAYTKFKYYIQHATTSVETLLYDGTLSLAAGSTYRFRIDVVYASDGLNAIGWYSSDGGSSFIGLGFNAFTTTAAWNTAAGSSFTTAASWTKTAGIVAKVNGLAAYLDNLRVTDTGSVVVAPNFTVEPSLVAFPTLTPITVSTESDIGAETLTVQPSYSMALADDWQVTEHPFDGGYTAVVARQTRRRRRWAFHWDALDASDITAIYALRSAVSTRKKAFTWADPETGESVPIRFTSGIEVSNVGPLVWQATATVEEVLSGA